MNTTHESDFYAWALEQAALLRAGKLSALDVEHLIEELEAMGRSERREMENRLRVLLMHLLEWEFQPGRRCASWEATIKIQRKDVATLLRRNPSLKGELDELLADAYDIARLEAHGETGLPESTFPDACPYTWEQATGADFWPE